MIIISRTQLAKSGVWVAATSFAILALPVLFESERSQVEQQQLAQQRQVNVNA